MAAVTIGRLDNRNQHDENGFLFCDCMGWDGSPSTYHPCKHVFASMKRGLDAETSRKPNVMVPMYEDLVDGAHLIIGVEVRHHEQKGSMVPFYMGKARVGWLSEDEGRGAMRRVLFEYVRSQYPYVMSCKSASHSAHLMSNRERQMLDLDSKAPTVIAAVASVLQNGECWRCLNRANDDLIPNI